MSTERLTILAAFIRSQAALTDGHPHKPGPGSVKLNNEEAMLCAAALEGQIVQLERCVECGARRLVPRPGTCCENETRNMRGGCDNCGDPCL